jgi:hypothetical protein
MVIKRYADECKSWEGWGSFVVEERDCKDAVGGDGAEARRAAKDARLYRSTRGSSGPVWPASFFVTYENSVTITLSTQWHYCQHVNLRNLLGGMDAVSQFPFRIPVQIS